MQILRFVAIARDSGCARALCVSNNAVIIISILFGGFFIEPRALPAYLRWARYLSFVFYGYDAAAKNEFLPGGRNGLDDAMLEPLNQFSKWENVAFLVGFAILYKLLYFVALLARGPKFDRTI